MKILDLLKKSIRDVPDFPKKGIIFKDITTLLKDPKRLKQAVDAMVKPYKGRKIDYVVCIEARGFVFGSVLAYKLGAGVVLVRKKGKLPSKTYEVSYDLEYGQDTLAIHQDSIKKNSNVLIVDDLLATGGTIAAVCKLLKKCKAKVAGVSFLIELDFLKGRKKLKGYKVNSLIHY